MEFVRDMSGHMVFIANDVIADEGKPEDIFGPLKISWPENFRAGSGRAGSGLEEPGGSVLSGLLSDLYRNKYNTKFIQNARINLTNPDILC